MLHRLPPLESPFLFQGNEFTIKDTLPAHFPHASRMLCEGTTSNGEKYLAIIARFPNGQSMDLLLDDQSKIATVWDKAPTAYLLDLDPIQWLIKHSRTDLDNQGKPVNGHYVFKGNLPAKMINKILVHMKTACSITPRKMKFSTVYEVSNKWHSIKFQVNHGGKEKRYCQFYLTVSDDTNQN